MKEKKMPVFGIGPIYVISTLILTIMGLYLDKIRVLELGRVDYIRSIFIILGIFLIVIGICIWIYAVIFQKINVEILKGNLITNGVYSYVRNPVYSAFSLIFTGILLTRYNLYLLILPIVFWIYLTILLVNTEEKWLEEKFGEEYIDYKNKVNRIIPWFKHKK